MTDREWAEERSDRREDLLIDVGPVFGRWKLRAQACPRGLPAPLSRKIGRQLSEYAGDTTPPCQIGVTAACATGAGQALIDLELYLPREWTDDRQRCRATHVPDEVGCVVKPRLAERMVERALPDLPEGRFWLAADEVYDRDSAFRALPDQWRLPYTP
ncbi:transposase [Streptomyces sp. Li-HN-5-11]|uniref:transposase n=1 Tax=Streptomyces sp. Li-HN-5-11 TaxID=3075432 RepID=UPI0037D9A649